MRTRQDKHIEAEDDEAHDLDQVWYWTPEWQKAEQEAEEDIIAGRVDDHETGEDFLNALQIIIDGA